MSDDIRVYWDRSRDKYYIFIGELGSLVQWGDDLSTSDALYFVEGNISDLIPCVYDSAEDEDYSLIDDNLVIPDVCYSSGVSGVDIKFSKNISFGVFSDPAFFLSLLDSHYYHEERTA